MQENKNTEKYLLDELKSALDEHEELNVIIDNIPDGIDEVTLQRIKKRRLLLKDKISDLKALLHPEIIA